MGEKEKATGWGWHVWGEIEQKKISIKIGKTKPDAL